MKCDKCGTEYELHKGRNEHDGEPCIDALVAQLAAERKLREAANAHLAALRERRAAAHRRANRALEDMRIALAAQKQAEERAAGLRETIEKMIYELERDDDDLLDVCEVNEHVAIMGRAALASQPADERGEERERWDEIIREMELDDLERRAALEAAKEPKR